MAGYKIGDRVAFPTNRGEIEGVLEARQVVHKRPVWNVRVLAPNSGMYRINEYDLKKVG